MPADRALLERVLASTGVERTPVPPESSYFGELISAAREAVNEALRRGVEMVHLPRPVMIAAAFLAAAVALFLIVRTLLPRLRRRRPAVPVGELAVVAPMAALATLDAAGWRAELERRLAAGMTAAALEAAWWWLARSLAGSQAEPDWTSRDLVARTRRSDLPGLIRRLDAFIYGPLRPAPEEVRSLVARLEEALS